jgi:hypothetical protein
MKAGSSTLRRTVLSDPAVYDTYRQIKQGLQTGIGARSLVYLEMLLASSHPDLLNPEWPEDIMEFM